MTAIASQDRQKLRDAVIAYMNGTISTYEFDDLNSECMDSHDESVRKVAKELYCIHDDTVDHPISVTQMTWDALIRIVAFLDTDLVSDEKLVNSYWPFKDGTQWNTHRNSIEDVDIPSYDPDVHSLPVHGAFNRIPTLVSIGLILLFIGLLFAMLIAGRHCWLVQQSEVRVNFATCFSPSYKPEKILLTQQPTAVHRTHVSKRFGPLL